MLKKILILFSVLLALAGCTEVPTGSVAIEKGFTGYISSNAVDQGLYVSMLTSYYPVDTTLTRATVSGMKPKDSHGVSLQDVSVVVTYHLDPARVAAFYRASKEMDQEPGSDLYTLGLGILEQSVVPYAVQIATEKSDLATISSNLGDYANEIQKIANNRLHELYPEIDPFVIQSVTVPTFELPKAIQEQVNAKAGYQAQLQTIAAQMQVVEQLKQVKVAQASIDSAALATAAKSSGVSVDQVIAWKRAEALQTLAGSGKATVLVDSSK